MRTLTPTLFALSLLGTGAIACGGIEDRGDADLDPAALALSLEDDAGDGPMEGAPAGDPEEAADAMHDAPPPPPPLDAACELGALRRRVIERYDEDGDGRLGEQERQTLRADLEDRPALARRLQRDRRRARVMMRRLAWIYDADDSRSLDETERQTMRDDLLARCEARRARVLERFDEDGDGTLDEGEREAARAAHRARMEERHQRALDEFDADGDGLLDDEERSAARAALRERMEARREALRAQFDADGDGSLSDAEKAALREHLRAVVRLEVEAEGPEG